MFNYDNDGLPDTFLLQGGTFGHASAHAASLSQSRPFEFRRCDPEGRDPCTDWQGVCAGDFDNDAYLELFIGQYGYDVLLRNQGNDRFRDETRERGLYRTELRWSTGCAFIDHDRDGFLDLVLPTTSTQRRRPPASPPAEWL